MAVVLGINPEINERFKFTLGEDTHFVESIAQLDEFLLANPDEQLVIVGPDIDLNSAVSLSEKFRVSRPSLGILLTRRRVDLSILNLAIRSGIREVINANDSAELLEAAKRSQTLSSKFAAVVDSSSIMKSGKMILVFSAKGGCGKTTISTNLAEALAATSGGTVCLVDLDLQFGDVGIALRINPSRSISNAVEMRDHLDKQALTSLVINYKPKFDVLLAPPNPVDAEYVTGELCRTVLAQLREIYDFVVIDSSPAFTDVILEAFDIADHHLLITTLDVPTLKNLRVSSSTLDELGLPTSKRIFIVNQSDLNAGLSVQDVERSIGSTVAIQIPASNAVPTSVNRGVTLFSSDPKHPVSRAIQSLTDLILDRPSQIRDRRFLYRRGVTK
jgi:pilus assembly protein CpaE